MRCLTIFVSFLFNTITFILVLIVISHQSAWAIENYELAPYDSICCIHGNMNQFYLASVSQKFQKGTYGIVEDRFCVVNGEFTVDAINFLDNISKTFVENKVVHGKTDQNGSVAYLPNQKVTLSVSTGVKINQALTLLPTSEKIAFEVINENLVCTSGTKFKLTGVVLIAQKENKWKLVGFRDGGSLDGIYKAGNVKFYGDQVVLLDHVNKNIPSIGGVNLTKADVVQLRVAGEQLQINIIPPGK